MDFPLWICCFLPLIIALWLEYEFLKNEKQKRILNIIKNKRRKGLEAMSEAIKKCIGKEVIITTMSTQIVGTVEAVEENWLSVKARNGSEIINVDYISRIREYPRNKNGNKKAIVS